jgi:hypothetical protein
MFAFEGIDHIGVFPLRVNDIGNYTRSYLLLTINVRHDSIDYP